MIGKGAFIASKAFAKKHYTSAVKAIKELKGPITKRATKVGKHITKHKGKYTAGVAGGTVGYIAGKKKKKRYS
jgi:hypothetical protein